MYHHLYRVRLLMVRRLHLSILVQRHLLLSIPARFRHIRVPFLLLRMLLRL